VSDPRSLTRDSSALLRVRLEEAKRRRHKVKQVAVMSKRTDVVFVPAPTSVVCPCRNCSMTA
jgi:hypothetical protein